LSAICIAHDALTFEPDEPFDAILLDTPVQQPAPSAVIRNCLGFAARTTSARLSGSKENSCATPQPCSSPEATMVYAVCSLLAEEGAKQVQAFLNEHRQFGRVAAEPEQLGIDGRFHHQARGFAHPAVHGASDRLAH
jgi:16S rRNA (cytosine967-C5)-methyltransferase